MRIDSDDDLPLDPLVNRAEHPEVSIQHSTVPATIPKQIEIYSCPNGNSSNKSSAVRSYFLEDAEEPRNDDDDDAWPVRSRSASRSLSHFESGDEDTDGDADSNDSFIVGDEIFD